ncbi:hypothetical protein [Methylobacterium sp. 1030]|uniref:hypothetical protein n=1 Tax=Methylobacterium sp. 1030 TaxID=3156404 RepID=UPI003394751D
MALTQIACPEWTEYRDRSGLDPLGMQNGSINLYQRLLPGISNVTLRMRYYGLYAWLSLINAEEGSRSTDSAEWRQLIRRSEALYVLAGVHNGDQTGVAGSRWAQAKLNSESGRIAFAAHADPNGEATPYLKQAYGAYGAAYGSQLFVTSVLAHSESHAIPVPSEEFGMPLAAAFATSIGDAANLFKKIVRKGSVTRSELDALQPALPSQIGKRTAERQLYEDLLFATGRRREQDDLARRDTLLLLLQCADHFEEDIQADDVRWLLYASASPDGRLFSSGSARLSQHQARWRVYQANDLLHYAYEGLLKFFLERLAGYPAGATLAAMLDECASLVVAEMEFVPQTWGDFVSQAVPEANASTEDVRSERTLTSWDSMPGGDTGAFTAEHARNALQLLATLTRRSEADLDTIEAELGTMSKELSHSLSTELTFLAGLSDRNFVAAIIDILQKRIINRHLWVAHRKFRQGDYTFLIEADDGRVRLRSPSGPVFTNPRLSSALTFLRDIHLVDKNGLTASGRKLKSAS